MSENKVDKMSQKTKKATVLYTKFTRLKNKSKDTYFCCFEGDDAKYYNSRILLHGNLNEDKVYNLTCSGKDQVLLLYKLITKDACNDEIKVLYFVDKDFDKTIYSKYPNATIYETPCYSIENFYISNKAFKRIIRNEFGVNDIDDDFQGLINLYNLRLHEYLSEISLLNCWIACEREKISYENNERADLNSNNAKISKFIKDFSLDRIKADYNLETIRSIFKHAPFISEEEIAEKQKSFSNSDLQIVYRGKYLTHFLFEFLECLRKSNKVAPNNIFKEKRTGVKISLSKANLLSELSIYADTPDCLIEYIKEQCS